MNNMFLINALNSLTELSALVLEPVKSSSLFDTSNLGLILIGAVALGVTILLVYLSPNKKEEKSNNAPKVIFDNEWAEKEAPEAEEDDTPEELGNSSLGRAVVDGKQILVRYDRSFLAKLIQSNDQTKELYADIHNYIMSYSKVRCNGSWNRTSYLIGRRCAIAIAIKGKTLCLYAALDEDEARDIKYPLERVETKRYASTPLMVRLKSMRGLAAAKKMVDLVMEKAGQTAVGAESEISALNYPYESTEELVKLKLIKIIALNGEIIDENSIITVAPFAMEPLERVSVEEAHILITDDDASQMIVNEDKYGVDGKKFAVNIDTLSKNFENGDTVNIEILKEKGIVPQKEKAIKILARGELDKELIVEAEDFSYDAVKMIVLVGGTAYKLKTK